MTSISKVEELQQSIEELEEEIAKHIEGAVLEAAKPLFDYAPEITAIKWNQYTPYFNDGDLCEFTMTNTYFVIGEDSEDYNGENYYTIIEDAINLLKHYKENVDVDLLVGVIDKARFYKKRPQVAELLNNFYNFLCSIDSKYFEQRFGNGVSVIVTENKILTTEYEHN